MRPGAALRAGLLSLVPVCLAAPASAEGPPQVLLADEPPFYPGSARDAVAAPRTNGKKRDHHGSRPYHPAPGIIVDVLDEGGAVAPALQRSARNLGYWPFRHCYEEGLRRDQALSGTVSFDLWVRPEGTVEQAEVTATTLRDEVVTSCVVREALGLALSPVDSPMLAKVRVLLATGDEPVPGPALVPHAEQLRAALRGSRSALEACYAEALGRHPDAGGRMELRFDLSEEGAIARVEESAIASRFSDAEATRCVIEIYRTTALPAAPRELRGTGFVYVVHFEPRSSIIPVRR
jgi:hypothetical protein